MHAPTKQPKEFSVLFLSGRCFQPDSRNRNTPISQDKSSKHTGQTRHEQRRDLPESLLFSNLSTTRCSRLFNDLGTSPSKLLLSRCRFSRCTSCPKHAGKWPEKYVHKVNIEIYERRSRTRVETNTFKERRWHYQPQKIKSQCSHLRAGCG